MEHSTDRQYCGDRALWAGNVVPGLLSVCWDTLQRLVCDVIVISCHRR